MPTYNVEITGLIYIDAESREDAIQQVKEMFYEEKLTIDDLHIGIDYETSDED